MDDPGPTKPTLPAQRAQRRPLEEPVLRLVVVTDDGVVAHRLGRGPHVIGRSRDAEIHVEHDSLSRRHAVLHVGATVEIEDCGSLNGTVVDGAPLSSGERRTVRPGQPIEIGEVSVLLQGQMSGGPRRLLPYGFFEVRIEEECARATRKDSHAFVLAALKTTDAGGAAIAHVLRSEDVIAQYAPGAFEVLFPEVDAVGAAAIVERLRAAAPINSVALAAFPGDGRSASELLSALHDRGSAGRSAAGEPQAPPAARALPQMHALIDRIAKSQISVVLCGETGVGKEVTARRVHARSQRAKGPFVAVNCGAFQETLLESELFGHERGAFTGATQRKPGVFELAHGGTLFLDEVAEMSPAMQVRLLRVLEQREVVRVGGTRPTAFDVRVVAASHKDLESEVARGIFREDLFFRLNGITISIPPLRERIPEIEPLALDFLAAASEREGRICARLSPRALAVLQAYWWPGNVRELKNVIERAVVLCQADEIDVAHLPVEKMGAPLAAAPRASAPPVSAARPASIAPVLPASSLKDEMQSLERQRILDALQQCAGNQTHAAKLLGISRRALIKRLETYNVPRPRKHSSS